MTMVEQGHKMWRENSDDHGGTGSGGSSEAESTEDSSVVLSKRRIISWKPACKRNIFVNWKK